MWPRALWDNSGGVGEWLTQCRESRKLILVIVAIALLLDNMLLTTVVPIIPEYLYKLRHPNGTYHHHHGGGRHGTLLTTKTTTAPVTIALPHSEDQSNWDTQSKWKMPQQQQLATIDPAALKDECQKVCPCPTAPNKGPPDKNNHDNNNQPPGSGSSDTRISEPPNRSTNESRRIQEMDEKHEELVDENVEVGVMLAVKAFVQLIVNPFIGPLTHRIGYSIPMFAGFVILFISTLIFAFGSSYNVLFIARALQGIGSSCSSVSGMGMLAERYPDDQERGNAMGLALGGLALGVLIGPPFGGFMYQYVNKAAPFLILAVLALGDGLLQLLVLQPAVKKQEEEAATLMELIRDPYIIISAGAITFANMGIGILEPSLPLWMMDTMHSSTVETGSAFLPASISYLIGTNLFGPCGHRIGRWLSSLIGLVVIGLCLMCIPMANSKYGLIVPNAGLGFAIGMVDSSMMPELANLVDKRHFAVYGSVYSIGDIAFCLGFAVGPALSGYLVKNMGFKWMLYGCAFINFLYAPLMYFLKCPPSKLEENQNIPPEQFMMHGMKENNRQCPPQRPPGPSIETKTKQSTTLAQLYEISPSSPEGSGASKPTSSPPTYGTVVRHNPFQSEPPPPILQAPFKPFQTTDNDNNLPCNGIQSQVPSFETSNEQVIIDRNPFRRQPTITLTSFSEQP